MTVASSQAGSWFWRGRHGEFDRARMLSATAASVEDFSLRFPLHTLVWENDYRKLEREIQTVCVCVGGNPWMLMYVDRRWCIWIIWLLWDFCLQWISWHAWHVFNNLKKLELVYYLILLQNASSACHPLVNHSTAVCHCTGELVSSS